MDLALLFAPLSDQPVTANQQWVTLTGMVSPVVLSRDWIDDSTAVQWFIGNKHIAIAEQVRAALSSENHAQAWALIDPSDLRNADLRLVLSAWAARRSAEMKLPNPNQGIIVVGADGPRQRRLADLTRHVANDLKKQLSLHWWPVWSGPLVVAIDDVDIDDLPASSQWLARPALPLLRIDSTSNDRREILAIRMMGLILECIDSEQTLPDWFKTAMFGVAAARARGEGPSPRLMLQHRESAGSDGIRQLLLGLNDNTELATAVGAYLCHHHRVMRMPALIELLRNQVDSLTALEIAYGIAIEDFIDDR